MNKIETEFDKLKQYADIETYYSPLEDIKDFLYELFEEYLKEWENSDDEWVKGKCDMARDILYDMKEIKGGNKE